MVVIVAVINRKRERGLSGKAISSWRRRRQTRGVGRRARVPVQTGLGRPLADSRGGWSCGGIVIVIVACGNDATIAAFGQPVLGHHAGWVFSSSSLSFACFETTILVYFFVLPPNCSFVCFVRFVFWSFAGGFFRMSYEKKARSSRWVEGFV